MHSRLSVRKGTYGISHTEMFMHRHAGYGAVERIVYNNDIYKDIYQESFPTRAGKDFLCHKTDFKDGSIGHYGNYVRTCLNEKPRLKYGLHIILFYRN